MELYAGLDLHSRNTYIGIMDKEFKRIFGKRVSNDLPVIIKTLEPFQDQVKGIVVESTFNQKNSLMLCIGVNKNSF